MQQEPTVLVVDDDDAIRTLVVRLLKREQYPVDEASNGQEALNKLRAQRFRAVILDLMMPVLSGFDVVRYLDQHDDAGDPCVIIMSAASERDIETVNSPHVHAVLRKPFNLPELVDAVRHCSSHGPQPSR